MFPDTENIAVSLCLCFLKMNSSLRLFSAACALCCWRVHNVNCIKQGINAWGCGSLVIADGNTDQRPLTVPWVFGLPLSAMLHYKKMWLRGWDTETKRQTGSGEALCRLVTIGQV